MEDAGILAESTHDDGSMPVPDLAAFSTYLHTAGWLEVDQDDRTSLWRPVGGPEDDLLSDAFGEQAQTPQFEDSLIPDADLPKPVPFGRRVTNRLMAATQAACDIADHVSSGRRRIDAFGQAYGNAPNATELAALAALGGPQLDLYQIRIARSPLAAGPRESTLMSITPGQQRIFAEAAEFLRTRQPRAGVTVVGLVLASVVSGGSLVRRPTQLSQSRYRRDPER
ncbi:MAG TPA: hypothetical protein VGX23_25300 [Actinocrinis sp.]|nr:hypothetical protein [Actinocrinis sp.]